MTKKIENLLVTIESQLDFSDEGAVGSMNKENIKKEVFVLKKGLSDFLEKYSPFQSEMMKKKVVLVGRPNVGKSSLFNLLVEKKVALVSDVPGTTRDVVRKNLFLKGVEITLEDTAGIRSGKVSKIEKMGMALTEESYMSSDLCLEVFEPEQAIEKKFKDSVVVVNKSDLEVKRSEKLEQYDPISISIKNETNIDQLISQIKKNLQNKFVSVEDTMITRERRRQQLMQCASHLDDFFKKESEKDFDKAAEDLRLATRHLGMLVGKVDVEEILGSIFNDFCIGK